VHCTATCSPSKFIDLCGKISEYSTTEEWKRDAPGGHWQFGGPGLIKIVRKLDCHLFYSLKSGEVDSPPMFGTRSLRIPWAVHAVFDTAEPHGTSFASLSEDLMISTAQPNPCAVSRDQLYVDAIVDYPIEELSYDVAKLRKTMRGTHTIPIDAFVLCRHGGDSTFNIDFVRDNLANVVERNDNLHVVLMNTEKLQNDHVRIHEVPGDSTVLGKATFFSGCDAMLHARADGETFGLAVAEFSLRNKPVITYNGTIPGYARAHLRILGETSLKYYDIASLEALIKQLTTSGIPARDDWNAYKSFSRANILKKFEDVFVVPAMLWWDEVRSLGISSVWEVPLSSLPSVSLICPRDQAGNFSMKPYRRHAP
jgi:hypothetical protein